MEGPIPATGAGIDAAVRGVRAIVRVGLILLAAMQSFVGLALIAPRAFYDDFPATGHDWVALLPPYNEHLVRDVGAFSLALTFVLAAAALSLERSLVRVALLALTVFALPHTIFHATHLAGFPTADAVAQTAGTIAQLLLTAGLFALTWRLPAPAPVPAPVPADPPGG